jgi:hypothetical protein
LISTRPRISPSASPSERRLARLVDTRSREPLPPRLMPNSRELKFSPPAPLSVRRW